MNAEGWYVDPYGLHDKRWFSDGTPTGLVSDSGVESEDPPPDVPFAGPLVEPDVAEGPALHQGRRGGSSGLDPGVEGSWEAFVETGGD